MKLLRRIGRIRYNSQRNLKLALTCVTVLALRPDLYYYLGMLARLCIMFCCCLIFGCGSPTYDVRAIVTLDGEPLVEAEVVLLSVRENGVSITGITDTEGEVTFTTDEIAGVVAGSYIITVSKTVEERKLTNNEIRALAEAGIRYSPDIVELVPQKYTRRETSDLRVRIGYWHSNEWTLDLQSEQSTP